jgi:hypothetical protein
LLRGARRSAILLIGGDKTGDDRFYERMIPIADQLYDVYIAESADAREMPRYPPPETPKTPVSHIFRS